MFCLRSWLPLLFIPTNASPAFILVFFICTYFLNRPCIYCSFLLVILFLTSCNWSDRCFFDVSSNWFQPKDLPNPTTTHTIYASTTNSSIAMAEGSNSTAAVVLDMFNTTVGTLATAAMDKAARTRVEWTGLGLEWLRSLLGRREWRIDCLDLYIRL
ncbi:bladder cancer-related protein BC10-domain-containing protein [Pseudoneurospora amorphoporcata]|uniref:Bladder cancer-related protein BC10-domain-containing protein n=1 Tax=Pseudoneurospora amorphoporcata TaxID=241081 RepID=A0AAN6NVF6_9PEZI|nr:bladder cancer-related protein BC10-domain-containing protein [Pseudoneurospora amorphoporcata]